MSRERWRKILKVVGWYWMCLTFGAGLGMLFNQTQGSLVWFGICSSLLLVIGAVRLYI